MNLAVLSPLKQGVAHWPAVAARLPILVSALLVVGLAGSLAHLTWRFLPPPSTEPAPVAPVEAPLARPVNQTDWVARLVSAHLFGEAPTEVAPPASQAPIEAPETALKLTLRGVYLADDRSQSYAIIADAGGQDRTYRPGDALPGGASLEEVYVDRVILERNGRLETLRLPTEAGTSHSAGGARSSVRRTSRSGVLTPPPEAGQILAQYRERLLNDPQSVMDVVRAEPYRRGGRIIGYRVFPGRDRGLLSQVGLQSGDVITEVNGLGLDNPLNGLEIMRDLQNASQVRVKVLRNGVEQELSVSLP